MLSSAVLLSARLEQLGDDVAPNKWTSIQWSVGCWVKSTRGIWMHYGHLALPGSDGTYTRYQQTMQLALHEIAWAYISTIELIKSGPVRTWSFRDVPLCYAAQSNTTRVLPGLLITGEWGRFRQVALFLHDPWKDVVLEWPCNFHFTKSSPCSRSLFLSACSLRSAIKTGSKAGMAGTVSRGAHLIMAIFKFYRLFHDCKGPFILHGHANHGFRNHSSILYFPEPFKLAHETIVIFSRGLRWTNKVNMWLWMWIICSPSHCRVALW